MSGVYLDTKLGTDEETRREAILAKKIEKRLLKGVTPGITIKRASSYDEILDALKLVYTNYVSAGYIQENHYGLRIRPWDAVPETSDFIALKEGRVVSTIGCVYDSAKIGLPSEKTFPDETAMSRNEGKTCEFTNLAIVNEYKDNGVSGELMRACFAQAHFKKCDFVMAIVSPEHRDFYKINMFKEVGSMRKYHGTIDDKVIAMRLDLREIQQRARAKELTEKEAFLDKYWYKTNRYFADNFSQLSAWEEEAKKVFNAKLFKTLVLESGLRKEYPELFNEVVSRWHKI